MRARCRRVPSIRAENRQIRIRHAACARGEHAVGGGRVPVVRSQGNRLVPRAGGNRWRRRAGRGLSPVMARREEWQEQVKLSLLLDKWLDPTCTFWTATDP